MRKRCRTQNQIAKPFVDSVGKCPHMTPSTRDRNLPLFKGADRQETKCYT